MSKIYLCGQIAGLSYDEARFGWRAEVVNALAGTDIECISPMRHMINQADTDQMSSLGDPTSVMGSARAITERDRFDVRRSDLLFCNLLGMDRHSLGSMIEFGWADAYRIPILCCIEKDGTNPHEHGMVQDLIGWRCGSLQVGILTVSRIFAQGL